MADSLYSHQTFADSYYCPSLFCYIYLMVYPHLYLSTRPIQKLAPLTKQTNTQTQLPHHVIDALCTILEDRPDDVLFKIIPQPGKGCKSGVLSPSSFDPPTGHHALRGVVWRRIG